MAKASGGTRTVSSANAASSRKVEMTAVKANGGANTNEKPSKSVSFNDTKAISDISFKGSVKPNMVLNAIASNVGGKASAFKTIQQPKLVYSGKAEKSQVQSATISVNGNKIEILHTFNPGFGGGSKYSYSINGGTQKALTKDSLNDWAEHPTDFKNGFASLKNDLKKLK